MATYSQELIFTVVPFGIVDVLSDGGGSQSYLNFSLVVSPRLKSVGDPLPSLDKYPDWAVAANLSGRNWPDTVQALFSSMRLKVPGLSSTAYHLRLPGSLPDDLRFPQVFPSDTPVIPYDYQGLDGRKIRSAPAARISDAVQSVYGRFGFTSPTSFPKFSDIVDATAFGPMGFQQTNSRDAGRGAGIPGSGEVRKKKLSDALEAALSSAKAIPDTQAGLQAIAQAAGVNLTDGAVTSLAFLQLQRFLQRDLPKTAPRTTSPPDPTPDWDFHKRVAGLGGTPTLQRLLGFVVDLQAGPLTATDLSNLAGGVDSVAQFSLTSLAAFNLPGTTIITPKTRSHLAPGVFKPVPLHPSDTDHVAKMLKLGDPSRYRVIRVDHDSAGIKAIQFANNVTRSRENTKKQTPFTPDNYALPALRTGGFAVARSGRAGQMVDTLARQTAELQNGGSAPDLYEDDLVRGYRFDVLDVKDGIWRSLMWRQGTITVGGADPLELDDVLEEDTVVPAPTQQSDPANPNNDLYLQETLSRWDGWSLAVPRIGKPFQSQIPSTPADSGSSGFNVTLEWHVPGEISDGSTETGAGNLHRLPRLRFGHSYRVRARIGDIAGNAIPLAKAPKTGVAVSPEMRHLRFEPLPAPRAVLQASNEWTPGNLRPGDSEEVIVIRSESATVDSKGTLDNGLTSRLLLPGRTSVFMAEQHEAFDAHTTRAAMLTSVFTDIANRDATPMHNGATLLHGTVDPKDNDTSNPWVYPNLLPIAYLPEFGSPSALIRNLPVNAFKKTTAVLPFDTPGNGWPALQAVRVRLGRGNSNTWTTSVVPNTTSPTRTTELDLTLQKGVEIVTLVNSGITTDILDKMAVWEWIEQYADAHNLSVAEVKNHIIAGEHWMFTPWRRVRFVHAVRTPLKNPVLLLKPVKTDIGQTFAVFEGNQKNPLPGTVTFSRRSTARVDIDAAWNMPIDNGRDGDPETPQHFTAHAFGFEPKRIGSGFAPDPQGHVITTVDAQNLTAKHEFHDTKYRAVTYRGTATSYYPEYFRESLPLSIGLDPISTLKAGPVQPGVAFEASTVRLVMNSTVGGVAQSRTLTPAPAGTPLDAPAPTPGDYIVTEDPSLNGPNPDAATHGTIQVLENSSLDSPIAADAVIVFSYVAPTIHTFSDPTTDHTKNLIVPNSARPKAPDVLYVIPIYKRTAGRGSVTRTGGGLRVYLNRPWWSSGDGERLGVVCWHPKPTDGVLPPDALAPYVTRWGFDPIFKSAGVPKQPSPACFPGATASRSDGALTIDEATTKVDVAGHDVHFDSVRGLWYCDIQVTDSSGKQLTSYTPFVKLALARYQPHSIPNTHLSRVVQVDYAQLAPNRHVTVSGSGSTRKVVVTGRAPRATWKHTATNKIVILIEQKDVRIPDDELAWDPATGSQPGFDNTITMTASTSGSSDFVTWNAAVNLPTGNTKPLRLAFEEYERIDGGLGGGRLAYTETILL